MTSLSLLFGEIANRDKNHFPNTPLEVANIKRNWKAKDLWLYSICIAEYFLQNS